VSCGKRSSRSSSSATGLISLSANSRAIVWIICCSSVNVSRIVIRPYSSLWSPRAWRDLISARLGRGAPAPTRPAARTTARSGRSAPTTSPSGRLATGGAQPARVARLPLPFQPPLELRGQRRHHLEQVGDDSVVGDLEDRRFGILVDGHDHLRRPHAREVLDGARHTEAKVELGGDGPSRLADLKAVRAPAGIDGGAR